MTDFADLKIRVDSRGLENATKQLDAFTAAAQKAAPALDKFNQTQKRTEQSNARFVGSTQKATKQLDAFSHGLREMSKASVLIQGPLGGMAARMVTLAGVFEDYSKSQAAVIISSAALASAIGFLTVGVIKNADAYRSLSARTKIMVGETGNATATFQNLLKIASETGSKIETVADVFNRVSLGAKNLGKSNAEITKTVELVSMLGSVSGASTANQQAGLLQFGQAMGQGVVRAEEWNSIMENITALGNEIAEGLGKSTSEVRKMVIDGKLLSKDVFEALQKRTLYIEEAFSRMPKTLGRSMNEISVEFLKFSAEMEKELRLAEGLASVLSGVAGQVGNITRIVKDLIPLIQGAIIVGGIVALTKAIQALIPMVLAYVAAQSRANLVAAGIAPAMTSAQVAVAGLQAAFMRLLPVLALVAAAWGVGELIKFNDKLKGAEKPMSDVIKRGNGVAESLAVQSLSLQKTGEAYDEISKKVDKTEKDKRVLDFAINKVAASLGITTKELIEQAKAYGSLSKAIQVATATQMMFERNKVLLEQKDNLTALRKKQEVDSKLSQTGTGRGEGLLNFGPAGPNSKIIEQKKKALADTNKKLADLDKEFNKNTIASNLSDMESLKDLMAGTASPVIDNGKKKNKRDPEESYKKDREELDRRIAQEERFIALREKSEQDFINEQRMADAVNKVRDKHYKTSEANLLKMIEGTYRLGELERENANIGGANALKREVGDQESLLAARQKGLEAYSMEKLAIEARNEYLSRTHDWEIQNKKALDETTAAHIRKAQAIQGVEIENLKLEADYHLSLANALSLSTQEYIKQAQAIGLQKKLDSFGGGLTDKQKTDVTDAYNKEILAKQNTYLVNLNREEAKLKEIDTLMRDGWQWDELAGERRNLRMERYLIQLEVEAAHRNDLIALSDEQLQNEIDLRVAQEEQSRILEFQKQRYDTLANAVRNYGEKFLDAFGDALRTGEFNFKKFTLAILEDLGRMIIQAEVLSRIFGGKDLSGRTHQGALVSLLSGIGSIGLGVATGGASGAIGGLLGAGPAALSLGGLKGFADGGVFSSPTMGVFGEAGPEAILPLSRGSNGKLGVVASGAGSGSVQYNNISVNVTGSSGTKDQNKDLADQIVQQMTREMKSFVTGEIKEQTRKGNILNPGMQF